MHTFRPANTENRRSTAYGCDSRRKVAQVRSQLPHAPAGQTLATFAIFNLAGLQFSPRIRDIGRLQLYRLGPGSAWRGRYPHAGPLPTQLG